MAIFKAFVAKMKQGTFSLGNCGSISLKVLPEILRASSRVAPLTLSVRMELVAMVAPQPRSLKLHLNYFILIDFHKHLHDIPALAIPHSPNTVWIKYLPHVPRVLEMVYQEFWILSHLCTAKKTPHNSIQFSGLVF